MSTDIDAFTDVLPDPSHKILGFSGSIGYNYSVSSFQTKDANGRFNGSCDFGISGGVYNVRFFSTEIAPSGFNATRWAAAFTPAVGYAGIGGAVAANTSFQDRFVIGTQSAHSFVINTADTPKLCVLPNGYVGIGNLNPSESLHIGDNSNFMKIGGIGGGISFVKGRETTVAFGNVFNGNTVLLTNDIERFRVDSSGHCAPGEDNAQTFGIASKRWSLFYAATGSINTSDEREKQNISAIPDVWLDAWGSVDWCCFRFIGRERWHVGLIAQRVHEAFADCGLDAFEIGLCCFDSWARSTRPETVPDDNGRQVQTGEMIVEVEAGDRWGLRYDECFAMEAAWQRRELTRAAEARAVLEARLAALEAVQI